MRVMKFGGSSLASPERVETVLALIAHALQEEQVVVVTSALEGVTDELIRLVSPAGLTPQGLVRKLTDRHLALWDEVAGDGKAPTGTAPNRVTPNAAWQGSATSNRESQTRAAAGSEAKDTGKRDRAALTATAATREGFQEALGTILNELECLASGLDGTRRWTPASQDWALGIGERASALLISSLLQTKGTRSQPVEGADVIRTDSEFGSAHPVQPGTERLVRWTLGQIPPDVVPVVAGFAGSDGNGRRTTLGRGSSDLTATLIAAALRATGVEIWTDVDGVFDRDPAVDPGATLYSRLSYEEARALAKNGAAVLHPKTLDPIESSAIPLTVRNTSRPHISGTLVTGASVTGASVRGASVRGASGPGVSGPGVSGPGASGPGASGMERAGADQNRIHLLLAGATGGVGRTVLQHLHNLRGSLRRDGVELRVGAAFSSRAQLWESNDVEFPRIPAALVPGNPTNWQEISHRVRFHPLENPILIDCTASPDVSRVYAELLRSGIPVVTPNKLAGSGPLTEYQEIKRAASENGMPFRYETTVGAALPILKTVRELRRSGDRFRKIEGVLSGTLSFVFAKLAEGIPFSEAVRQARDEGYTEPHPREDLSGMDVARKLLILLREAGYDLEPDSIPVESLVPDSLRSIEDPEEFLELLAEFDDAWATRLEQARGAGLGYVAWFHGGKAGVGVREIPEGHPLFALRPTENRVVLTSDLYPQVPLTIAGPGAGREVTASGVVSDLLDVIQEKYGVRRVA